MYLLCDCDALKDDSHSCAIDCIILSFGFCLKFGVFYWHNPAASFNAKMCQALHAASDFDSCFILSDAYFNVLQIYVVGLKEEKQTQQLVALPW